MKTMKNEIELRLIGSLLSDWCRQQAEKDEGFVYRSGFDSTHRVIRFTTPMLQSLFALPETRKGHWANGNAVMYEIHNSPEGMILTCTASATGLGKRECARLQILASACGAAENKKTYRLAEWNISDEAEGVNSLAEVLDQVLAFEVAWFESELAVWKKNPGHQFRAFPKDERVLVNSSELPEEIYMEGAQRVILTNRYERNPKARARCIAVHGSACQVCGFDFGIAFGEEFSGKIEVHHIKPISEIGEEYVVDPVRDLVPVCPNCHMMLHSKSDGVYSINEIKLLREKHGRGLE
jgi:hypothetical protein